MEDKATVFHFWVFGPTHNMCQRTANTVELWFLRMGPSCGLNGKADISEVEFFTHMMEE